jgi:CBS domain containing-hemolysin-like protein
MQLGRLAELGDVVEARSYRMTVLTIKDKRAVRVNGEKLPPEPQPDSA